MPAKLVEIDSRDTRARCDALVSTKIQRGFHRELGMNEAGYRDSFQAAIEGLIRKQEDFPGVLALVEERIPFVRQLELLGIEIDPGIFYEVVHHQDQKPYGVQLEAVASQEAPFPGTNSYTEAIAHLPACLRSVTPFEGINAEVGNILAKTFVVLSGGEYKMPGILTGGSTRFDSLCLDEYRGKIRISRVRFNTLDPLVGMLVAHT